MNSTNSVNSSNSANSQSHLAQVARTVTRPIIAIIFTGVLAQVVIEGIAVPDWFIYGLAMPCILWWFGERTITHIAERRNSK
jgi:hypothetical protein